MIRPATAADSPAIAEIYRPFCEDSCVSFETSAPGAREIAARIETLQQRFPWLVEDIGGKVAGYAYACAHRERAAYRWAVEVTVYVHEDHRKKGVGRRLYVELFERLSKQGYYRACAGIVVPNPASQAFHESLGFTLVGIYRKIGYKLGAWRDVGWWQRDLRGLDEPPAQPLPTSI